MRNAYQIVIASAPKSMDQLFLCLTCGCRGGTSYLHLRFASVLYHRIMQSSLYYHHRYCLAKVIEHRICSLILIGQIGNAAYLPELMVVSAKLNRTDSKKGKTTKHLQKDRIFDICIQSQ